MKKALRIRMVLMGWLLASLNPALAFAAESVDPYVNETPVQHEARMAWWREARFGMFVHFGVYSVPAGVYHGKDYPSIGEWLMFDAKIPMAEYQTYAKEFNPTNFNPDDWVRLAKAAGMKYIVITAKHHEGFAMFDTKASDWNIAKASPYGKDLLKPLCDACRKYGMKLGFYYSQAQDWNNGGSVWEGKKWDPAQQHSMDDYLDRIAVPQVRELMSNYGEFPNIIWWDTPVDMNSERASKLLALIKLKPGIIQNNRLSGDYSQGDTETPEQNIPATGFAGRDWETCMTMNDTWGFKVNDHNWKTTETLIHNLVDVASKGGNYLLNVGPDSSGLIPEPSIERLKAIGAWMKVNGDAIYGTTASPFKRLPWGRCTKKISGDETTLYLHVFDWPKNGQLLLPGLKNQVESARLLAGGKNLKFNRTEDGVIVKVPNLAPDSISSALVLKIKDPPQVAEAGIIQEFDGSVRLLASEAQLQGGLRYESGDGKDNIGYWEKPEDTASWTFKVNRPGKFKITAATAGPSEANYQIILGDQKITGTAPATEAWTKFTFSNLKDALELPTGKVTVSVKAVADGWHPVNLKSLTFNPVSQ